MKITTLNHGEFANTYVIGEQGEDCIIVDPGYNESESLNKYVTLHHKSVKGILLTHGHFDHILGLKNYLGIENIPVFMFESEIEFLDNDKHSLFKGLSIHINPYGLDDEDEIKLIGLNIKVIHTPFHTSGSVCYLIESINAIFTGDTLFKNSIGRTDLPTGSQRMVEASLQKLKSLSPDLKVYPGHGSLTTLDRELKYNPYFKLK